MRLGDHVDEFLVHALRSPLQRTFEVHEQNHTMSFGLIPYLMLVGIVKDQAFSLFPVPDVISDPDSNLFLRLGNNSSPGEISGLR